MSRYDTVNYSSERFSIHPLAHAAYRTWVDSGPMSQKLHTHRLISESALVDGLQHSPLPVIKMSKADGKFCYGIIGRFNIYYYIHLLQPPKVTLVIVTGTEGRAWPRARLEAMCQAMWLLEIGGRCDPLAEMSAVIAAARESPWRAFAREKISLRWVANVLGIGPDRLRQR